MGKIMRVAFYTRLSPNPEKDDTVNQERDLIEYARVREWEVIGFYKEIHVSGAKKGSDRPEFKRMMLDAYARKFDVLMFWALDRFTREGAMEAMQYFHKLKSYGVDYKSYTEPHLDSTNPLNDVLVSFSATMAKQERARLIDRTKAGLQTARDKGVKLGRAFATRQTKNRPIPVDIVECVRMRKDGKTLKQIARKFKASEATICRYLKSEGVTRNVNSCIVVSGDLT
jgi:DNA invertase Pin-like site-specific DNA recombinase